MINSLCITPSPERDRGNGLETRPGIEASGRGNVIPNLPAIARTLAIHGGEEVSYKCFDELLVELKTKNHYSIRC